MAKKKKAKKKLQRNHSRSGSTVPPGSVAAGPAATGTPSVLASAAGRPGAPPQASPVTKPVATQPWPTSVQAARSAYVGGDVRRTGVLVTACVLAELVLWYAFGHTGLGSAVYGLVK
jgi:hypothetical protein